MAEELVPLLIAVGFIGIGLAIYERGYKSYQEEKQENPGLKFDFTYLHNMIMTTIGVGAIVSMVPLLFTAIREGTQEITIESIAIVFGSGYLVAFRVLDGLNSRTEKKRELGDFKKAVAAANNIDVVNKNTNQPNL